MLGGYNVESLIGLLEDTEVGSLAADGLSHTLLMFNAKHDVIELAETNENAKRVVDSGLMVSGLLPNLNFQR